MKEILVMMRKLKLKSLTIAFAAMIFLACSGPVEIYVSPQGDNSADGTLKNPLLTLEKARDVARGKRIAGAKGQITVFLRNGDYYFEKPVVFEEADSNLIILPYGDEKVRFTGGISIDPQQAVPVAGTENERIFPESSRQNIRQVDLKKLGITNYGEMKRVGFSHAFPFSWMELFINGEAARLSRWPNDSVMLMGEVLENGSIPSEGDTTQNGGKFIYSGNRPAQWKASRDMWLFGYFRYGWADDAVKISAIDTVNHTFTTAHPHRYGYFSGKPYNTWYAFNIPEEIDAPGEYYIDRENGILYFFSPEKVDKLEVSVLEEPFLVLKGSSDITFRGITMECSRSHSVDMIGTNHCQIDLCVIRNLGSFAVNIADDENGLTGKNNGVSRCTIEYTAAGGVQLTGGNRQTLEAAGNYVENCSIHDFNRIAKTYCAGVKIRGVGNRISHNEIFNGPHCAILMSGNDHLVEFNDIHDVCLVTDDVGALYYGRNPSERGHLVRHNYFHHLGQEHRCSAVYHDDGACGMQVFGNVFYKAGTLPSLIGGGSDNPYINNIFIDSPVAIKVDNRLQAYEWAMPWVLPGNLYEKVLNEVNHSQPPYSIKYPELARYWDDNPAFPKRNVVDKNVFVRIGQVVLGDKKFLEFSENNFVTQEDPGFENESEQDFRLKETSAVFQQITGFQPIPFEKIGVKK